MSQPFTLLVIVFSYVYFIYRCGPKMMRDRKAYNLRATVLTYNAIQVLMNCSLFIYVRIAYTSTKTKPFFREISTIFS